MPHPPRPVRHAVDVEDFRGGNFYLGGIVFEGQTQQLYWQAVERYLAREIHETFKRWDNETEAYPKAARLTSLEATRLLIRQLVSTTVHSAVDTDRRLRGRGFPDNVPVYDAKKELARANEEIVGLEASHRSLVENVDAPIPLPVRIEAFATRYRGIVAIIALIAALVFGLLRFFHP